MSSATLLAVSSAAETKRCPDCAEQVLAAARKCRYCGYRFDGAPRTRISGAAGLLAGLRQDSRESTLEEVLAEWGVGLAAGEQIRFFRLADVDGDPGFLLVTDGRVAFLRRHGRRRHDAAFESPLADVAHDVVRGRLARARVRLLGPGWIHVVRTAERRDVKRLLEVLGSAAAGTGGGGRDG